MSKTIKSGNNGAHLPNSRNPNGNFEGFEPEEAQEFCDNIEAALIWFEHYLDSIAKDLYQGKFFEVIDKKVYDLGQSLIGSEVTIYCERNSGATDILKSRTKREELERMTPSELRDPEFSVKKEYSYPMNLECYCDWSPLPQDFTAASVNSGDWQIQLDELRSQNGPHLRVLWRYEDINSRVFQWGSDDESMETLNLDVPYCFTGLVPMYRLLGSGGDSSPVTWDDVKSIRCAFGEDDSWSWSWSVLAMDVKQNYLEASMRD